MPRTRAARLPSSPQLEGYPPVDHGRSLRLAHSQSYGTALVPLVTTPPLFGEVTFRDESNQSRARTWHEPVVAVDRCESTHQVPHRAPAAARNVPHRSILSKAAPVHPRPALAQPATGGKSSRHARPDRHFQNTSPPGPRVHATAGLPRWRAGAAAPGAWPHGRSRHRARETPLPLAVAAVLPPICSQSLRWFRAAR